MDLSIEQLKSMARGLRAQIEISHSASLEMVAKQLGYKNWNVLIAKAASNQPSWKLGMRVSGEYLGKAFQGELIAVQRYSYGSHHAITVQFDTPIKIAKLGDQYHTRVRVSAVIDENGVTAQKSSDGKPHMVVRSL